jgi:hypothetical protein
MCAACASVAEYAQLRRTKAPHPAHHGGAMIEWPATFHSKNSGNVTCRNRRPPEEARWGK